jgi:hypothetical protein
MTSTVLLPVDVELDPGITNQPKGEIGQENTLGTVGNINLRRRFSLQDHFVVGAIKFKSRSQAVGENGWISSGRTGSNK